MRRIGITQRVDVQPDTGEVRDSLDQAWGRLLAAVELVPVPLANTIDDVEGHVEALDLAGVILSGGNDLAALSGATSAAPLRDHFEGRLLDHCERVGLPVLGVCRGLQFICSRHGFDISGVEGHVATEHEIHFDADTPEFWTGTKRVNSFHSFGVRAPAQGGALRVVARDADGLVEAVVHETRPWIAVMWHPERGEPFRDEDLALLRHLFGA